MARKHTLVRTGKFLEWTIKYNPRLDATKVFDYNEYFPIPQGIIDANTGAVMVDRADKVNHLQRMKVSIAK